MIEVLEEFNSGARTLKVFNYSDQPYSLSSSIGTITGNEISVPDSTVDITITITYADLSTEVVEYTLKTRTKTYIFSNSYMFPRKREHIFLNGYIRKFFQGWSTAGTTDFSSSSRLLSAPVFSLFNKELETILLDINDGVSSVFPFSEAEQIISDFPIGVSTGYPLELFLSHLTDFTEELPEVKIFERVYSTGGARIIGNEYRREAVAGNENCTYSSRLMYGSNNLLQKTTTGIVNSQTINPLIFKEREPLLSYSTGHFLTLEDSKTRKFYSPVEIDKHILTIFGDVFILGTDKKIYYGKLEVDIPEIEELNPSINNNNIVEICGDYFCPSDSVEIVVDMEYLRNIKANSIVIKVSNQSSIFYITDNEEFSLTEKRIPVTGAKNVKFVLDTEDTDRFIKVEVFVDQHEMPYIAFSSAMTIDLSQVGNNSYTDIMVRNNRVHATKLITELPLETDAVIISGKYSCSIIRDGKYVSFKI